MPKGAHEFQKHRQRLDCSRSQYPAVLGGFYRFRVGDCFDIDRKAIFVA